MTPECTCRLEITALEFKYEDGETLVVDLWYPEVIKPDYPMFDSYQDTEPVKFKFYLKRQPGYSVQPETPQEVLQRWQYKLISLGFYLPPHEQPESAARSWYLECSALVARDILQYLGNDLIVLGNNVWGMRS